jgi:hypothetical protein
MRHCSRVLLLALACVTALAAGAGGSAAQPSGRAGAVITVSCRDANLREPNGVQRRVILGVVSVPQVYLAQVRHDKQDGWAYSTKAGITIQAVTVRSGSASRRPGGSGSPSRSELEAP